jgi:hypothetical protein
VDSKPLIMAQISIAKILIGVLVFGMVVGTFGIIYTDWGNTFHITPDSSFVSTYNKMNETNALAVKVSDTVSSGDVTSSTGAFGAMTTVATAIKLIMSEFDIVKEMATSGAVALGIPPIFASTFIAIILLVIIFTIIMLLVRPYSLSM